MRKAIYYLMDVFTEQPFSGNQLAIFPDGHLIPEEYMPLLAKELNLSESVFILPTQNHEAQYRMRIFTPGMELPTAGHPTIGTALYLARNLDHAPKGHLELLLEQPIGLIKVELEIKNNQAYKATMYQPLPDFGQIFEDRDQMASLLGLTESDLMDYPIQIISCGVPYLIIPVKDLATVRRIGFRLDVFQELSTETNGAFVYAFTTETEESKNDLHGRMFAPEAGILEDPATGSANGPLGCYVQHYQIKKSPFLSEQGYEMGRPSLLYVDISTAKDGSIDAVKVGGQAVFTGRGEIYF